MAQKTPGHTGQVPGIRGRPRRKGMVRIPSPWKEFVSQATAMEVAGANMTGNAPQPGETASETTVGTASEYFKTVQKAINNNRRIEGRLRRISEDTNLMQTVESQRSVGCTDVQMDSRPAGCRLFQGAADASHVEADQGLAQALLAAQSPDAFARFLRSQMQFNPAVDDPWVTTTPSRPPHAPPRTPASHLSQALLAASHPAPGLQAPLQSAAPSMSGVEATGVAGLRPGLEPSLPLSNVVPPASSFGPCAALPASAPPMCGVGVSATGPPTDARTQGQPAGPPVLQMPPADCAPHASLSLGPGYTLSPSQVQAATDP